MKHERRSRRAGILVALPAALILTGVPSVASPGAATSLADDLHNIPGVPLSAASVSGKLGGPVYDDVYRVVVPAGHILLAAMTGNAGTDFDMYLFDVTATDIYAQPPVGLVAKSTGPTSTESITFASLAGGTFYIDLSGYSTTEGTFHLAVQILADTTPPRVAVSLDGGAPATNKPVISVTVVATDSLSGVASMSFSTDGTTWTDPEPYQPTRSLDLGGPDGSHTVWVRVTDAAGNVSGPARATIVLDRTPPTVVERFPDAGATVPGLQPTIAVRFSEAIQRSTWTNSGLLLQDASGTIIYGTYGYDPATFTGTFLPAVTLQPGAPYVVSLGSVTDLAGNPVALPGGWTFTPLLAPALTLQAATRVAPRGAVVALNGRMSPVYAGPLVLEQAVAGGRFLPLVPLATGIDGAFHWSAPILANVSFRVVFGGSDMTAETVSPTVTVLVRRQVSLATASPSVTRVVPAFTRETLTARVTPAGPPVPVTLWVYRYTAGRGYVLLTKVTRTTAGGQYSFSWTPGRGSYQVRLTAAPSPFFANGVSPIYRWTGY